MLRDRPDSLEYFTITFRALPGRVPAAIRVRHFLKLALRAYGLVNEGIGDPPAGANPPSRRRETGPDPHIAAGIHESEAVESSRGSVG